MQSKEIIKLGLRLYRCDNCARLSMTTTNHRGAIYNECKAEDMQTSHTFVEDVKTITLSKNTRDELPAQEFHEVIYAMGRILPADYGRRVYLTKARGAQVEGMDQYKKRIKRTE